MDSPLVLLVLLALPIAVGAVILAVSYARRSGQPAAAAGAEPDHRLQADTAAVQRDAVYPRSAAPAVESGRERRAASADRPADG